MPCFLSCFILSLVIPFCCALATVVQEPSRNNTTLHFKSLLKHWRSYPRCDQMGLYYHVSWLLMDRLFTAIGFTTSLISSLLSLTKSASLPLCLREKYFWSKQMGTWLPLLSMCVVCCVLHFRWLTGSDPSLFPFWDPILLWFRFMSAEILHVDEIMQDEGRHTHLHADTEP